MLISSVAVSEVHLILRTLRDGAAGRPDLRQRFEELAAYFDDEYLRLNEEGDEANKPEALRLFSKARAASALAFAFTDDSGQLYEAIYEAIAAL